MKKFAYTTSQLFNFAEGSYLERTSRPFYALIFLLPFIVIYEIGTIFINTDVLNRSQGRVVAFVWLQEFLEFLGFPARFAWIATPLIVVIILIALQLTARKKWYFKFSDYLPMSIECTLLAVPLIVLSLFLNTAAYGNYGSDLPEQSKSNQIVTVCSQTDSPTTVPMQQNQLKPASPPPWYAEIVTGIGAGIYEELFFRLIMISIFMIVFQDFLGFKHDVSIIISVLLSAALFSAHHHIFFANGQVGQGAAFNWIQFGFRTFAGVYFAVLFSIRGYGITSGTHAFYDILATCINTAFFS